MIAADTIMMANHSTFLMIVLVDGLMLWRTGSCYKYPGS